MYNTNNIINEITKQISEKQNDLLMEQLNDLVSRGLLIIEHTQPVLVRSISEDKIELRQAIKLTLKDKEYIIKLEEENEQMKNQLEALVKAVTGVLKDA